jgi:protein-tyrosine phosphatase
MDFILENLAIGNYQEALAPASDINALICVAAEHDIYQTNSKYYKVPIVDMQPIPTEQLKDAILWLRSNIGDSRIMVFCNAGIGRSPSVVVAFLCCVLGYSFGEAVEYVAIRRPYMSILPNLIKTIQETKLQLGKD